MVRPDVVQRKLSQLHGYLTELEVHRGMGAGEYARPGGPRREVERLIQLVVEVAVDLNVHVATELSGSPPSDYRSSFPGVAQHGVISAELAQRLAPAAGLRNVLVHEYGEVRDELVHGAIPRVLDEFREYAEAVQQWLDRARSEEGQE